MRERLRDKSRDTLTAALNVLGVDAGMAERGRAEEDIQKPWGKRSLGIIDISEGMVRWINVVKQDGSQHSPPKWWTVLGIPDDRPVWTSRAVRVRTVRRKSFPLLGRVISVQWKGEEHDAGLIGALSIDPAVMAFAMRTGDLEVRRYTEEFQGWTLQVDRVFEPTHQDWAAIERTAEHLLRHSE